MIKIIETKTGTIEYTCDCGVVGECVFKPKLGSVVMVLDIICPMCNDKKRLKLIQYETEEERDRLKEDNDVDYYWPIIIDNNVT